MFRIPLFSCLLAGAAMLTAVSKSWAQLIANGYSIRSMRRSPKLICVPSLLPRSRS